MKVGVVISEKLVSENLVSENSAGSTQMIFVIHGMDCISCAKGIKNYLHRKLNEYIDFVDIDFQSGKMFVKIKKYIDPKIIINEVKNIGYGAELEKNVDNYSRNEKKEYINVFLAITFASFIFVVSMFFHDLLVNNKFVKTIVFILSTFVQFINGYKFYRNAFYSLRNGILNMDLLIVISTTTAYFYSLYAYFNGLHHLYFETSAVIIAVVLLGKFIEEKYRRSGFGSVLNLLTLKPRKVNVYRNELVTIDVEDIKRGDVIEIHKGQSVPVDGIIIEGEGIFDLSLLFGENQPVLLKTGNEVLAGSFLIDGLVKIKANEDYKSSFWKGIESSVFSLSTKTSNYQLFIDKISGNFVVIVIILALLSFIYWYFIGNKSFALNALISTLIIACPCAIGLASPLAINKGMIESSKKQIIVKDPYVFEKISKSKNFVFDKTGTITNKNVVVNDFKVLYSNFINNENFNEILEKVLVSVSKSNHPLSVAIKDYIVNNFKISLYKSLKKNVVSSFRELTSLGIKVEFDDKTTVIVGNYSLIQDNIGQSLTSLQDGIFKDNSQNFDNFIALFKNEQIIIVIGVEYFEEMNKNVEKIVELLKSKGKNVIILTGANENSAMKLAKKIKVNEIIHSVDAVNKVKVIEDIKKKGLTVFVGDGINDSLVMNAADVGISFEYGSDITQNSASVILKNFSQIEDLVNVSYTVFRKLKFNLFWVFGYNVVLIPVAMGVFYNLGVTVNPMLAALAMVLSDFSLLFFNLSSFKLLGSK